MHQDLNLGDRVITGDSSLDYSLDGLRVVFILDITLS